MNIQKIAEKFAGESCIWVGGLSGTRYADGAEDRKEYFESKSGKHVVVEIPHKSFGHERPWAHGSDGVVW